MCYPSHPLETYTSPNYVAEVHHDPDAESPYDQWDQIGLFAANPRRHWRGQRSGADWSDALTAYYRIGVTLWDQGMTWERIPPGFAPQEPDPNGDYWTRSTLERFDAIAYTTRARAEQMHSAKVTPAQIWEALELELRTYRQWRDGEVYGVTIHTRTAPGDEEDERHAGDHVDSCWGFLGYDSPEEPAREMLTEAEQYRADQIAREIAGGIYQI